MNLIGLIARLGGVGPRQVVGMTAEYYKKGFIFSFERHFCRGKDP